MREVFDRIEAGETVNLDDYLVQGELSDVAAAAADNR